MVPEEREGDMEEEEEVEGAEMGGVEVGDVEEKEFWTQSKCEQRLRVADMRIDTCNYVI